MSNAGMAINIRKQRFKADKLLNDKPTNTMTLLGTKSNEGVVFFMTEFEFQLDSFMLY